MKKAIFTFSLLSHTTQSSKKNDTDSYLTGQQNGSERYSFPASRSNIYLAVS